MLNTISNYGCRIWLVGSKIKYFILSSLEVFIAWQLKYLCSILRLQRNVFNYSLQNRTSVSKEGLPH